MCIYESLDSCTGFTIISTAYVSNKHKPSMIVQLHTCVHLCCFKLSVEMQVVEMIVRPPYVRWRKGFGRT